MEEQSQTPVAPKKSMMPIVIIVVIVLLIGGYVFSKGTMKQEGNEKETGKTQMQEEEIGRDDMPAVVPPQTTSTPVTTTSTPDTTPKSTSTPTTSTEVKTFTVKGSNFAFSPSEIKVNKGDKVKIVFENSGGFHDFVIDEFNAKTKQIQSGATETIEFIVDKTGTFEFYCSVGKHREMGMKGNLIVQ